MAYPPMHKHKSIIRHHEAMRNDGGGVLVVNTVIGSIGGGVEPPHTPAVANKLVKVYFCALGIQ